MRLPIRAVHALLTAFIILCAGCASVAPALTDNVGGIRSGIASAREQTRLAFDASNQIATEQAVERKLDNVTAVTIAEDDFPLAVSRGDAERWAAAFGALDAYAAALQDLVDPKHSQATGNALQGLGKQLQTGGAIHAKVPPGLAGFFASLGEALVGHVAATRAIDVMSDVDPAFRAVMQGMADAIGPDNTANLRGTVHANWQDVLSRIRITFAETPGDNRAARRRVIEQFRDALDARDVQDRSLGQLQSSLLALGEAHSAAARGAPREALFWVQQIDSWLDDVRRNVEELERNAPRDEGEPP